MSRFLKRFGCFRRLLINNFHSRRQLVVLSIVLATQIGAAVGTTVQAGAFGIRCERPVVFSNSDVNIGVIPFTTSEPDENLEFQSNTFTERHSFPATQLARIVQFDTLFSLRYAAGMGVVHFQGEPSACEPEAVIKRIQTANKSVRLKHGKGMVLMWGNYLTIGQDLYAQSYLRFLRRGIDESITLKIGKDGDSFDLKTGLGSQSLSFTSRLISEQELSNIYQSFQNASTIYDSARGNRKIGNLPKAPDIPFAFSVSKVDVPSGRMLINPYKTFNHAIPEGWINARFDTKSWPIRSRLPELNYLNAMAGYLAFRVVEKERPTPNWAGTVKRRLRSIRNRSAESLAQYRQFAVKRRTDNGLELAPLNGFDIDGIETSQLRAGPVKSTSEFVIPAPERSALAWSHGLLAIMDLILSNEKETDLPDQESAINSAKAEIERAIAFSPTNPDLLNLAALIEFRECCMDGHFEKVQSAESYLRKALAVNPGHRNTIMNLSRFYSALEKSETTAAALDLNRNQLADRVNAIDRFVAYSRKALLESTRPVSTIYFRSRADIDADAKADISNLISIFNESGANRIELHGYSDPGGATDANLEISKKRVSETRRLLIENGIPAESISSQGHGEVDPIGDELKLDKLLRRRVEIFIRE